MGGDQKQDYHLEWPNNNEFRDEFTISYCVESGVLSTSIFNHTIATRRYTCLTLLNDPLNPFHVQDDRHISIRGPID